MKKTPASCFFIPSLLVVSMMTAFSPIAQGTGRPVGPEPKAAIFFDNFDSFTAPPFPANGWWGDETEAAVQPGMQDPPGTPRSGANVLVFNTHDIPAGTLGMFTRTSTAAMDLSGYAGTPLELRFWMYHDSAYPASGDSVTVIMNTGGSILWAVVWGPYTRYRAGAAGWELCVVDISDYTCPTCTDVRFGFGYTSGQGNNIFIDDMGIYAGRPDLEYQYTIPRGDVCDAAGAGQNNGYMDPGETITRDFVLKNNGLEEATGIAATLTAATAGITVISANSDYPDIAAGETGTNLYHFSFRVGDEVPCGTVLDMNLHVTADGTREWDFPFVPMTGTPAIVYMESFDSMSGGPLPSPWSTEKITGQEWVVQDDPMFACSPNVSMRYPNNTALPADSWAYSPPLSLTAGTIYTLTLRQSSPDIMEVLGVYAGTLNNHADMTVQIMAEASVSGPGCELRKSSFTVPATGDYYLGFHARSLPGGVQMNVDDIVLFEQVCSPCLICPAISLSPSSLPFGILGQAYSETISASGGTAPYTFEITSGTIPKFLELDPATGALSGTPAYSGTYPITVTATDDAGCPADQSYSLVILEPPGAPVITNITDGDVCAQSGIVITFTPGSPATRHDLYRDGLLVQSGVASPAAHNPGNGLSHSYVVRAINTDDSCYSDSAAFFFADVNGKPSQPVITNITDPSLVTLGLVITYSAGSPAARHDLYKDGALAATGFMSGMIYTGTDNAIHDFSVAAVNGACATFSAPFSAEDKGSGIHPAPILPTWPRRHPLIP